jgi:hypothetical protein
MGDLSRNNRILALTLRVPGSPQELNPRPARTATRHGGDSEGAPAGSGGPNEDRSAGETVRRLEEYLPIAPPQDAERARVESGWPPCDRSLPANNPPYR